MRNRGKVRYLQCERTLTAGWSGSDVKVGRSLGRRLGRSRGDELALEMDVVAMVLGVVLSLAVTG